MKWSRKVIKTTTTKMLHKIGYMTYISSPFTVYFFSKTDFNFFKISGKYSFQYQGML